MIKNYIFRYSLLFLVSISVNFVSTGFASSQPHKPFSIHKYLQELEASSSGHIGVFVINTANNKLIQYRAHEHFPFQSTFKIFGVAAILKQSMTDSHLLQQKMTYTKQDLVYWSPITKKHLIDGMTISELCAATLMFSDDTAINLLMKKLGGPAAVTSFARSIGDHTFKLESWEAELNSNPNDLRDSSTPEAMGRSLQQLALGNILASPQREQFLVWLKSNTTGDLRIRAGVPKDWIVGDKTGTGDGYGVTNDIAIIWPPKAPPIIMAIYFNTQNKNDMKRHEDVIASVSRMLINSLKIA
jgi:beta-lactamase class A